MTAEQLRELGSVLGIPEDQWESVSAEQLLEEDDLDYTEVVGLADLKRSRDYSGTKIYLTHLVHLVHLTYRCMDVWVVKDTGKILRSYTLRMSEEIYPE